MPYFLFLLFRVLCMSTLELREKALHLSQTLPLLVRYIDNVMSCLYYPVSQASTGLQRQEVRKGGKELMGLKIEC